MAKRPAPRSWWSNSVSRYRRFCQLNFPSHAKRAWWFDHRPEWIFARFESDSEKIQEAQRKRICLLTRKILQWVRRRRRRGQTRTRPSSWCAWRTPSFWRTPTCDSWSRSREIPTRKWSCKSWFKSYKCTRVAEWIYTHIAFFLCKSLSILSYPFSSNTGLDRQVLSVHKIQN